MISVRLLVIACAAGVSMSVRAVGAQDPVPPPPPPPIDTTADSSAVKAGAARDTAGSAPNAIRTSAADTARSGIRGDTAGMLPSAGLILVNADAVDRLRFQQLRNGVGRGQSLMLRSASSLTAPMQLRNGWFSARLIPPELLVVRNTELPFSENNSAMWAGRGTSTRTVTGFRLEAPYVRVIFAPQIVASDNAYWELRGEDFYAPELPRGYEGRGFAFPFNFYTFPVDVPLRMGGERIRNFDLGESTVMLTAAFAQVGWSNENQWWGPGIRNALILSNNAPGFPHLFARTARPIRTPAGDLEMRWLAGSLTESRYFDTVATNNIRSIASLGVSLQTRWDPNLTVGVARSVYATARNSRHARTRWLHVFSHASRPNPDVLEDVWASDTIPGGRDELLSLFARWVFPSSGAEVYAEWGRTSLPHSPSDFLIAPNHTQGYTLGMQWRGGTMLGGDVRFQAEVTQLEQSATWRDRPVGSWYTSTRVLQGYTNKGQVIGAAIGPGASSQFAALDYVRPSWQVGGFIGRSRLNEDVHGTYGFPIYVAYCSHDVLVYPGLRGNVRGSFGTLSGEVSLQNRLVAFFQNAGGCPNTGIRRDIRNKSFRLVWTPSGNR